MRKREGRLLKLSEFELLSLLAVLTNETRYTHKDKYDNMKEFKDIKSNYEFDSNDSYILYCKIYDEIEKRQ